MPITDRGDLSFRLLGRAFADILRRGDLHFRFLGVLLTITLDRLLRMHALLPQTSYDGFQQSVFYRFLPRFFTDDIYRGGIPTSYGVSPLNAFYLSLLSDILRRLPHTLTTLRHHASDYIRLGQNGVKLF